MNKLLKIGLAAVILLLISVSAIHLLIPQDNPSHPLITSIVYEMIALLAIITILTAVLSTATKRQKWRWSVLMIGVAAWLLGNMAQALPTYLGLKEIPYVAHILNAAGYICVMAAAIIKYTNVMKKVTWKDWSNGVLTGVCIIIVAGCAALLHIAQSQTSIIDKMVQIFYPVADAIVISLAVVIISSVPGDQDSVPWFMICAGLVSLVVAHTLSAYFSSHNIEYTGWVNIITIAGLIGIGFGAYYRRLLNKGCIEGYKVPEK